MNLHKTWYTHIFRVADDKFGIEILKFKMADLVWWINFVILLLYLLFH